MQGPISGHAGVLSEQSSRDCHVQTLTKQQLMFREILSKVPCRNWPPVRSKDRGPGSFLEKHALHLKAGQQRKFEVRWPDQAKDEPLSIVGAMVKTPCKGNMWTSYAVLTKGLLETVFKEWRPWLILGMDMEFHLGTIFWTLLGPLHRIHIILAC